MSKLKVNELDTESGTTITVAAGKTIAGTDIIGATQLATDSVTADAIAANAVDTSEIAANAVTLAEMAGITRGSIIVGDASGDPSYLATGSTGQYLTTDGTDTSWGAVTSLPSQTNNAGKILTTDASTASWTETAGRNLVINGDMEVWQRGITFGSSSYYQWYADRWNGDAFNGNDFTISKVTTGTPAAGLPATALRFQRDASSTETNQRRIGTVFETAESRGFAGKEVTLSFYARVGSNWSGATNVCTSNIFIGTGTNETTANGLGAAWTGYVNQSQSNTMTTTYQRFSQTVTLAAGTNQLGIQFVFVAATGTAGANDYVDITGIKLEVGSEATSYIGENLTYNLLRCQRYYYEMWKVMASYASNGVVGWQHPVRMRATPSFTWEYPHNGTASNVYRIDSGAQNAMTSSNTLFIYDTGLDHWYNLCLLYTSPRPRDATLSRMPSSA